ncbi:MAG: DUF1294 domain-containing protein [Sedimentisphaerales bacterium]|nr:DUF1294 domain-containing protein [Sedimentisphaerales bacterium]
MHFHHPKRAFLLLAGLLLIGILAGLAYWTSLEPLWAYWISVSCVTFGAYGYDKRQSRRNGGRVPEAVLHILALAGGTPAAAIGQILFRHKTRKLQFRIVFFLILFAQLGVLVLYCLYGRA